MIGVAIRRNIDCSFAKANVPLCASLSPQRSADQDRQLSAWIALTTLPPILAIDQLTASIADRELKLSRYWGRFEAKIYAFFRIVMNP